MISAGYVGIVVFLGCNINVTMVNGLIGRHHIELAIRANKPLGETLVIITGCSEEQAHQIITVKDMELPLKQYDA